MARLLQNTVACLQLVAGIVFREVTLHFRVLLAWERNVGDRPVTTEGFAIQEAQGTDGLVVSAPRALLFFDEIELVLANVLGPELFGRALEISSEMGDTLDIGLKRPLGVVAQTEVFEIPLT